jgi:ferredoxin
MIYHALAEALAWPVAGMDELLLDAAQAGAEALGSAACRKAILALAELHSSDLEKLRKSYSYLIASPDRRPVALYESLHCQGCLGGPATWQVEGHYRALGLSPVDGELPDHASVELTFLGHLATAEAEAQVTEDGQLVARLRAEQHRFLHTHAGAWLPNVGGALAAADDPFYAAVGCLLSEFLAEELTGRQGGGQTRAGLPALRDPGGCTLCGLCVGSCPQGALRVIESTVETALTLNPSQCISCDRCVRICPEEALSLSPATPTGSQAGAANGTDHQVLRQSPRAACPHCGRPTVSQAELGAVLVRLQADAATQQRMSLCIDCKSGSR